MNSLNIKKSLQEQGYICNDALVASVEVALATRPTAGAFLFGPAGSGKSELPQALARALGREVIFFQCFPGTREDDLLVKLIPHEESISGIMATDGPVLEAAKASQTRPVFLILDEWDKTRPSADSFLLDFLQSGRIRFNGRSCTANLSNLTVWVTMNDEREISEPLLRRLPLIQFNHLPASIVKEALQMTHPDHPYIPSALILYERCLMAGLPKPATIQELRQLLDAISLLGERADWDSLVFQFVTKTREAHELLRRVEGCEVHFLPEEREKLDPQAYEAMPEEEFVVPQPDLENPRLPRVAEARGMASVSASQKETEAEITPDELATSGGLLALTDEAYDAVVGLASAPSDDPHQIGDVGEVRGKHIILRSVFSLSDPKITSLFGLEGEIVLSEPSATLQDVIGLRRYGWKIVKYSTHEVLAKTDGADLRWTENGAEIVVSLSEAEKVLQKGLISRGDSIFCTPGQFWYHPGCKKCDGGIIPSRLKEGRDE